MRKNNHKKFKIMPDGTVIRKTWLPVKIHGDFFYILDSLHGVGGPACLYDKKFTASPPVAIKLPYSERDCRKLVADFFAQSKSKQIKDVMRHFGNGVGVAVEFRNRRDDCRLSGMMEKADYWNFKMRDCSKACYEGAKRILGICA